jgi:16S rRNA (guanine(966)-N(2))-methyltransferase RsmD
MRVIAGEFRSRRLTAPAGAATRPTSDKLRETLFNVLAPRIEGAALLDLYAGSGAVGIEALSRGAARVTFVENSPSALAALRANVAELGLRNGVRIQGGNVSAFLRRGYTGDVPKFDLIFLDPPWDDAKEYESTLSVLGGRGSLLAEDGLTVAEHRSKFALEDGYGRLKRTRLLKQGDAGLSFYAAPRGDAPE